MNKQTCRGNSTVVQWLGCCAFTAEGEGLIPGLGNKIPQACNAAKNKQTYSKCAFRDMKVTSNKLKAEIVKGVGF